MSSVKISQLNLITQLNANTQNTLFVAVDVPSGITGKFTGRTLAQGLFSNEVLNVGNNSVIFPNTIAQFAGNSESYLQMNMQNFKANGSADMIITADTGSDSTSYIDLGINNSNYSQPSFSATRGLDGYLYVAGPTTAGAGGNLIIGTASSLTNVLFIVGGTTSSNIVAKMTNNGLSLNTQSFITYSDSSIQSTAAAPFAYTNVIYGLANTAPFAYVRANASFLQANAAYAMALAGIGTANAATTLANSAFSKANNALANTTGTFAGDLTLTGNLIASGIQSTSGPIATGNLIVNGTATMSGIVTMNAQVFLTNGTFSNTQSALTISATANVATPSNDGYMIHISGKQNVASRIVSDSYGANTYVVYAGRTARGNVSNPTAVQTGDILSRFSGNGYGTTGWSSLGSARIDFVASENYTDTNRGSQIQFWNVPVGSNTLTQIATFNGTSVSFTGSVNPQKGFIYTPHVYPSSQTAITIDFSANSVVRANTSTGCTVSFANYTAGKVVDMWITNTAGTNQTFTHGCSAINSTVNSTTYTIPGTSTIYVKYMSFDGDLANTFVAITHA
jgi:hypothetical protein